jgi:cbb3-type cytochrome oxidase maturation protein
MEIIYILLPASIILALVGLAAFIWSVRNNQFEDLQTPAKRMLLEEDSEKAAEQPKNLSQ